MSRQWTSGPDRPAWLVLWERTGRVLPDVRGVVVDVPTDRPELNTAPRPSGVNR